VFRDRRGSLRRRLLTAFVLVAAMSVVLLTAAALVGTDRGVNAAQSSDRRLAADWAAAAVADAYQRSGGWNGTDLRPAQAIADAADAQLVVRDADAAMMWPGHAPSSAGPGTGMQSTADTVSAGVVVDGTVVGTVYLVFGHLSTATGRSVAWTWVAAAAIVALALALAAGGLCHPPPHPPRHRGDRRGPCVRARRPHGPLTGRRTGRTH